MPKDKNVILKLIGKFMHVYVPDKSISKEEYEVRKWVKGLIYVGITCYIWVHRIVSTLLQIILRNNNGESF